MEVKDRDVNGRNWYAVYTRSRHEKRVYEEIVSWGIEAYLPLIKKRRQWSDRIKWVEMPLLSGYVFVNVNRREYFKALQAFGAVCYVGFGGKATPIPPYQIDNLKILLREYDYAEIVVENFSCGDPVEVKYGPMQGLKGEVIRYKGKERIVLRIDQLNCNIITELHVAEICAATET